MNIWQSIWQYKCPRCRQTKLFNEPFQFTDPLAMPKHCGHCDQKFEPEPGFYYGAMFTSYALCTFSMLPLALFLVFYFKWSVVGALAFILVFWAAMSFRVARLSRSLWIHFVVKFDESRITSEDPSINSES